MMELWINKKCLKRTLRKRRSALKLTLKDLSLFTITLFVKLCGVVVLLPGEMLQLIEAHAEPEDAN
jgi:hypothetical protein